MSAPAAAPAFAQPPGALSQLDDELARQAPFAQMSREHRLQLLRGAEQVDYADDEVVLEPASGPVRHLYVVRRGAVVGSGRLAAPAPFVVEPGEVFPAAALLGDRPVTATYRARGDTACLRMPRALVDDVAAHSPAFADHLNRRVRQLLELAQRALQGQHAARALAELPLESPLARFVRATPPLAVGPRTPLAQALRAMHERGVGSIVVVSDAGAALGILTQHDIVERVALAERALATPIAAVMSAPVHTLDVAQRAHDAALLMGSRGVRHVPITRDGRVVGIVSERDLFALQRLSLRQLGAAIDGAADVALLREAAADIRRYAVQLLAQGVQARALTELFSHLNDRLTARLVTLAAHEHGLDLADACWLAFGSEGRGEQTIATDQDNGIVHRDGADNARWRAFGRAVNLALDACGYPLCKGGIMAGEPACCLSRSEWLHRFERWIEHGAPQDLLHASIFFDLRPLAGAAELAQPLRAFVAARAAGTPRFLRQLAENALQHGPPLAWYGAIGVDTIDLKMQGTAIFVEAARLLALATGTAATATRERLLCAGKALGVPDDEVQSWVAGFEYLQLLRLGAQVAAGDGADPNRCDIAALNAIDRRVLRETLRVARTLQQRVELDYMR